MIEEFLKESNHIEGVYDEDSLQQALYAWKYLIGEKEMTPHVICKTHKILMLHQKLDPDQKGYFRKVPVWIGGKKGMSISRIPNAISDWCEDMNNYKESNLSKNQLERISEYLHVNYEKIHPFVDGNGRTGRMFMNWWRIKNGLPILIIKADERGEYYKWFK